MSALLGAYVLGVDVGTGSARAGLFDAQGNLRAQSVAPIQTWKPRPDFVEQSSDDIWQAIGRAIRDTLAQAQIKPDQVVGISFDATCSLVVLDKNNRPLAVNAEGDNQRNIIVWMDHRALAETEAINAGGFDVLQYVGGRLSPEMETPKLRWLKTHLPETWRQAGHFFDLADYLTFRASGSPARSLCTLVCKWTYLGHDGPHGRWDRTYFEAIGLADALDDDRIGSDVRPMGTPLGPLTPLAAQELGLTTDCQVGVGMIDAHAGGLGVLGALWQGQEGQDLARLETALALIGGTSNCHMAVSREPKFMDGIWGPYYGAMVPQMWLTEGGQSAAGSAIDQVIANHANAASLNAQALVQSVSVYALLNAELERLRAERGLPFPALLTRDLHVLPDFLGNRSPHADPNARALVDGLTLDESLASQALLYYATLQAVAYGTRDIVDALNRSGYRIDSLYVTGGATKNSLWLQEHADATGLNLVLPGEPEAVLLGAAMLAATAAGLYPTLPAAMQAMSRVGQTVTPNPAVSAYHAAKFAIFRDLYLQQRQRKTAMSAF